MCSFLKCCAQWVQLNQMAVQVWDYSINNHQNQTEICLLFILFIGPYRLCILATITQNKSGFSFSCGWNYGASLTPDVCFFCLFYITHIYFILFNCDLSFLSFPWKAGLMVCSSAFWKLELTAASVSHQLTHFETTADSAFSLCIPWDIFFRKDRA